MTRADHRHASKRAFAAQASATLLCLLTLAACASAATATTSSPAGGGAPAATRPARSNKYGKPLLSCTNTQQSAATGGVHVLSGPSPLTLHVTVGERIELAENSAIRPNGTGVGEVSLFAGQHVICQNGNVQGHTTGTGGGGNSEERLPLIITQAGHATIQIIRSYLANSPQSNIVYIDATAAKAAS